MQSVENVVICAAGMGSRLGLNTVKCLVEINGKTILQRLIELTSNIKNIRIVVGFMEEKVIAEALRFRSDIIFVRNPNYRTTSNVQSLQLGSFGLKNGFISIDGDMIIDKNSFTEFLSCIEMGSDLIGIARSESEDAVFTILNKSEKTVERFSRSVFSEYEWCGIAYLCNIDVSKSSKSFVYEIFEDYLPLKSKEIVCSEIDTPADLRAVQNKPYI